MIILIMFTKQGLWSSFILLGGPNNCEINKSRYKVTSSHALYSTVYVSFTNYIIRYIWNINLKYYLD